MSGIIINRDFREGWDFDAWTGAIVISDPPYNQGYHYDAYSDRLHFDAYSDLLRTAFHGHPSVVISYPEETINVLAPILGKCEQVVAWVYNSNTAKQSRLVTWWGCKPDLRKVSQEYKNPTDKRIAKRIAEGKTARLYDWWEIDQVKNVSKADNPHPCPIPYELARRIVLTTTEPGQTVIDPFCGSGTIVQAAADHGRNGIGFEIDPSYAEWAMARILP
jgi:hypothetical protein